MTFYTHRITPLVGSISINAAPRQHSYRRRSGGEPIVTLGKI